ncbi:MAG: SIMPL domain-containing protein [Chryseobacterium sp.]
MKNIFILHKNLLFIVILTAFTFLNTKAQVGGNQIYRNPNQYDRPVKVFTETNNNYYTTDSTLVISVKVLMNQTADKYKIILGVNEEALTPKKSIEGINQRINGFIKKISSLGIKEDNVFVDFISQTKIYDYDIDSNQNTVTQKNKGFETKKNIIITVDKYALIEKIIYEASDFKIYDVIKVDYMNADIDKIQEKLLKEAYSVLDKKKDNYFSLLKKEIIGSPTANSGFSFIFPKSQYQNYSAFESSDVSYMSNRYDVSYIRKEERKAKTYYYEGTDYSGFDKVINESKPEIGIQYILSLTVKYDLKKNKK